MTKKDSKSQGLNHWQLELYNGAAEAFRSDLCADSVDEIVHAKRKTLNVEDLHMKIKMKGYQSDFSED